MEKHIELNTKLVDKYVKALTEAEETFYREYNHISSYTIKDSIDGKITYLLINELRPSKSLYLYHLAKACEKKCKEHYNNGNEELRIIYRKWSDRLGGIGFTFYGAIGFEEWVW